MKNTLLIFLLCLTVRVYTQQGDSSVRDSVSRADFEKRYPSDRYDVEGLLKWKASQAGLNFEHTIILSAEQERGIDYVAVDTVGNIFAYYDYNTEWFAILLQADTIDFRWKSLYMKSLGEKGKPNFLALLVVNGKPNTETGPPDAYLYQYEWRFTRGIIIADTRVFFSKSG